MPRRNCKMHCKNSTQAYVHTMLGKLSTHPRSQRCVDLQPYKYFEIAYNFEFQQTNRIAENSPCSRQSANRIHRGTHYCRFYSLIVCMCVFVRLGVSNDRLSWWCYLIVLLSVAANSCYMLTSTSSRSLPFRPYLGASMLLFNERRRILPAWNIRTLSCDI